MASVGAMTKIVSQLHLARWPFRAKCGADNENQVTTEVLERVTCLDCLRAAVRDLRDTEKDLRDTVSRQELQIRYWHKRYRTAVMGAVLCGALLGCLLALKT